MEDKPVETRIKCEFLDLPGVYHFLDGEFQEFFGALGETENMDFFNLKSVQAVVNFNYGIVRRFITYRLFYPFCVF